MDRWPGHCKIGRKSLTASLGDLKSSLIDNEAFGVLGLIRICKRAIFSQHVVAAGGYGGIASKHSPAKGRLAGHPQCNDISHSRLSESALRKLNRRKNHLKKKKKKVSWKM